VNKPVRDSPESQSLNLKIMDRRSLIKNIALGTGTLFLVPSALVSCEDEEPNTDPQNNDLTIDLNDPQYSALTSTGGSVIVQGIIVVNTGAEYVALSSICTHQGCQVTYDSSANNLPCPCHGSLFSISGNVLNGPASQSLRTYPLSVENDVITIDLG